MDEAEVLSEELEHYRSEKERVSKIIGQIGGRTSKKRDTFLNIVFLFLICFLFAFTFVREIYDFSFLKITSLFSIELAVLLVSLKIIWMIHKQNRVNHFQFWVLNSIEFQINLISKRIRELENRLNVKENGG